eukprot:scaffold165443_cov38-Prasinocladus_malaysianus.AAC.1
MLQVEQLPVVGNSIGFRGHQAAAVAHAAAADGSCCCARVDERLLDGDEVGVGRRVLQLLQTYVALAVGGVVCARLQAQDCRGGCAGANGVRAVAQGYTACQVDEAQG